MLNGKVLVFTDNKLFLIIFFYSFSQSRLRTCTLRKDYEGQAVLINCLLRNYLYYNLYDQVSVNFPPKFEGGERMI